MKSNNDVVGHEKLMKFLIDHLLINLSFFNEFTCKLQKDKCCERPTSFSTFQLLHVHPFLCFVFNVGNELNSNVTKIQKKNKDQMCFIILIKISVQYLQIHKYFFFFYVSRLLNKISKKFKTPKKKTTNQLRNENFFIVFLSDSFFFKFKTIKTNMIQSCQRINFIYLFAKLIILFGCCLLGA